MGSNYAFNPIAELSLRSNQTIVPQRVNAALGVIGGAVCVQALSLEGENAEDYLGEDERHIRCLE